MKRQLFTYLLLCITSAMLAQMQFKPIKVDVGLLLGEISDYNTGVIAPYIEPKYQFNDFWSLGLRGEYVIFSKEGFPEKDDPYWGNLDADGSVFSLNLTIDKYFTKNKVRPFIGTGAGYFLVNSKHTNNYLNLSENLNTGGIIWRAGLMFGNFKLSNEYNYVFSNKVGINYYTLKLGYEIGGGKKRIW